MKSTVFGEYGDRLEAARPFRPEQPVRPEGQRRPEGLAGPAGPAGPAGDPRAPYVRVAVVGLINRGASGPGDEASTDAASGDMSDDDASSRGASGCDASGGSWLLLHRSRPFAAWDPPGGRMERGEDLAQAVRREVAEETGLQIRVGGPCYALLTVYEGERLLAVSMACRLLGDIDNVVLEPGGADDWRWASAEEWGQLAVIGQSSWSAEDVRRATRMATVLWRTEEW